MDRLAAVTFLRAYLFLKEINHAQLARACGLGNAHSIAAHIVNGVTRRGRLIEAIGKYLEISPLLLVEEVDCRLEGDKIIVFPAYTAR